MGSFIICYCKQIRKSKVVKADLEGPAHKLVRPFHKNNISLQFQMEECQLLLTDQIDLLNRERRTPATHNASTGPSAQPQDDTSANVVHDTLSPANAKTGADTKKYTSKERTVELDEGQARSDPGKTLQSQPPPERVLMEEDKAESKQGQSHVVQAGPNPEP
nr:hypothetical protein [Tanacetum cinerariifolium]